MELLFSWIQKFRNYNEIELNFSDKFIIKYDNFNKTIEISPNKSYVSIYPEYITNINAIVGKNSVGKTNLLDVLGLKPDERNKNNAEFEVIYKNKKKGSGLLISDEIDAQIKHSIYFFIYYLGKDENTQDLFCFEGNDIESFQNLLRFESSIGIDYWKNKYWFAFICNYHEGRLIHKYDLNDKLGDYRTESHEDGIRYYGDCKNQKDKLVIISLRENLNDKHYDFRSTEPKDDYKISVPRRVAKFQSIFLSYKIEMLYNHLKNPKRHLFQDDKYILKISYNSFFLKDSADDENTLVLSHSYKDLAGREKEICKILESFVQYYYNSILRINKTGELANSKKELSEIKVKKTTMKVYKDYYLNIVKHITDSHFTDELNKEYAEYIVECFKVLSEELSENQSINFKKDYISLEVTKKAKINEIKKVISITV